MTNASVTLPSDEFTMPVRCPNHPFQEILRSSYGFTGIVASTILFNFILIMPFENI